MDKTKINKFLIIRKCFTGSPPLVTALCSNCLQLQWCGKSNSVTSLHICDLCSSVRQGKAEVRSSNLFCLAATLFNCWFQLWSLKDYLYIVCLYICANVSKDIYTHIHTDRNVFPHNTKLHMQTVLNLQLFF